MTSLILEFCKRSVAFPAITEWVAQAITSTAPFSSKISAEVVARYAGIDNIIDNDCDFAFHITNDTHNFVFMWSWFTV